MTNKEKNAKNTENTITINYERIITEDYNKYVTRQELKKIKEAATMQREFVTRNGRNKDAVKRIATKAIEIAYTKSQYQALSNEVKSLFAANIAYSDVEFAIILNKCKYDPELLRKYIKILDYLKRKHAIGNLSEADKKLEETVINMTTVLMRYVEKFAGETDHTIMINKINEILSYKSLLLQSKPKVEKDKTTDEDEKNEDNDQKTNKRGHK